MAVATPDPDESDPIGITVEEFEHLPEALSRKHELIDGALVKVPGNTPYHNSLRELLARLLGNHIEERKLGKILCEQEYAFDEWNVHGSDISFIGGGKLHQIEGKRRVQPFVPDLAIEIASERDTFNRLMKKAACYRAGGTNEVWILEPETRHAFALSEDRHDFLNDNQMFESRRLPGFSIRLGELFDRA